MCMYVYVCIYIYIYIYRQTVLVKWFPLGCASF